MKSYANEIEIRPVTKRDAEGIANIYNHYVSNTIVTFEERPCQETEMLRRIEDISTDYPFIVAVCGDDVVGYCYVHAWKRFSAYRLTVETTIYMSPDYTSYGVGHMLMERVIEMCRVKGYHALIACITSENEGSIRFHSSLGFTEVSHFREVGYKFGRYLDITDMQLLI